MKNKMKRITLLTLGLISAGATLHGCDAQDCTEMGCTDNYTLSLQAPGEKGVLTGGRICCSDAR